MDSSLTSEEKIAAETTTAATATIEKPSGPNILEKMRQLLREEKKKEKKYKITKKGLKIQFEHPPHPPAGAL